MNIEIKRINPKAVMPKYETTGAAGFDFVIMDDIEIAPNSITLIPTGLVIKTPAGYMLMITPRSSTPKKTGLSMPHSIGIVDCDYCGPQDEVKLQFLNPTTNPIKLEAGQRIAQGIFVKVDQGTFVEVDDLNTETRGGFGSTGH